MKENIGRQWGGDNERGYASSVKLVTLLYARPGAPAQPNLVCAGFLEEP